jgi:hypothetical protein
MAKGKKKFGSYRSIIENKDKTEITGITEAYAFNSDVNYHISILGKRLLFEHAKNSIKSLTAKANFNEQARTKVQFSPFYTNYPANLAAPASIGLTLYLVYKEIFKDDILTPFIQDYLDNPKLLFNDFSIINVENAKKIAKAIASSIETRLILHELEKNFSFSEIELYRLYQSSLVNLKHPSISEILNAIILYGDVLILKNIKVHETTSLLIKNINNKSKAYFKALNDNYPDLIELGTEWFIEIFDTIQFSFKEELEENSTKQVIPKKRVQFTSNKNKIDFNNISPISDPTPPSIENADSLYRDMLASGSSPNTGEEDASKKVCDDFLTSMMKASGNQNSWMDQRSDISMASIKNNAWSNLGIMEGEAYEGHEIKFDDNGKEHTGQIFDEVVDTNSVDEHVKAILLEECKPLISEFQKILYPNISVINNIERFKAVGRIDNSRISSFMFSDTIYQRQNYLLQSDAKSGAVITILTDFSGSINRERTKMIKLLMMGVINSFRNNAIKLLAGYYNEGYNRNNFHGSMISWISHPEKCSYKNLQDGINDAIANMPESGSGCQADALSLLHCINEAKAIAKGRKSIYLIHLTDTAFLSSFSSFKNAKEEVKSVYKSIYDQNIHISLVALSVNDNQETGYEDYVDVIKIQDSELDNPESVALKIGKYVFSIMKNRKFKKKTYAGV